MENSKKPSKFRRRLPYWVSVLVLLAIFAVFFLRLFQWQIKDGDLYLEQANATSDTAVRLPAARGEILDRNGQPLVSNVTAYKIVFRKPYMTKETTNDTIHALVELLRERKEKWVDELPITLEKGTFTFKPDSEEAIAFLKGKQFLNVNSYTSAELCIKQLADLYEVDPAAYTDGELLRLLSVRYNMTMQSFSAAMPYTFAESVSKETMSIIQEHSGELPGVTVQVTTKRTYPSAALAPHLLGTVGKLTQEEYDTLSERGYRYDDVVGKSGIERAMEAELRGEDGTMNLSLNQSGGVADSKVKQEPVQGNTVYTTIDSSLQQVVMNSLSRNVRAASRNASGKYTGEDCIAGAAVVLRVEDFAVLAAGTYPTYDLGKLQEEDDYYSKLLNDETNPMFNRATNGVFTPGSIFKPCVAAAALQEGVLKEDTKIVCRHWYEYFAPSFRPTCMGWHGSINVATGLQYSCNVFFFETGRQLGIKNMNLYAKSFGLGVETGIEIGESSGVLAGPEERAANGGTWQPGDVIQAAIGQSDNGFTPLQLATYCATIANDGTRLRTHLVDKVTDYSRKNVISETKAEVVEEVPVSRENMKIVQQGMRQVITGGTASGTFSDYGIAIAGKTGTAEVPGHSDNETFIGYAPYDDPKIAIAVVIQYGANSNYSLGVAKDIFDAYFYGKIVDEKGNLVTPAIADSADGITDGLEYFFEN